MLKKTVWLVSILLLVVFLYTTAWPYLNRPPKCVDAPEYCEAILEYARNQMADKYFDLPAEVTNWQVEDVVILSMEDIPGPHHRKRTTATLSGSYETPPRGISKSPHKGKFSVKLVFNIGSRYPEGIDVQHIRFP